MIFQTVLMILVVYLMLKSAIAMLQTIDLYRKLPNMPLMGLSKFGQTLFLTSDPTKFLTRLKKIWVDVIESCHESSGKFFLLFASPIQTYIFFTHPDSAQDFLKNPKNVEKAGILQVSVKRWYCIRKFSPCRTMLQSKVFLRTTRLKTLRSSSNITSSVPGRTYFWLLNV